MSSTQASLIKIWQAMWDKRVAKFNSSNDDTSKSDNYMRKNGAYSR